MSGKRLLNDSDNYLDKREGKRMRSLPSFTMIIRQAVAANYIQNLCHALEPVIRRVVQEEVERGLVCRASSLLQGSSQMFVEEPKPSSDLQLIFKKSPSHLIFTENKINDKDGFPLEILLKDSSRVNKPIASFTSSIKVEIVILDGDFSSNNSKNWSSTDFNRHVVKERRGKRPLLIGDTFVTLKDGSAFIDELKLTDNSSWIRSRNFRLGVRVLHENQQDLNIREAVTSPFIVKDHRGECYMKHYLPLLGDEVWRLKNISKDGKYHKRLIAENINSVQDFLKLSVVNFARLQKILKMSDRTWEVTINHARTCLVGDKLYLYRSSHYTIVLNPICKVVSIESNGVSWPFQELSLAERATIQTLILDAYNCWGSLEEISLPLQEEPMNQVDIESHQIKVILS